MINVCVSTQIVKDKLQIGVKKRVENCTLKSKKGDFLHMHYKVSFIILLLYIQTNDIFNKFRADWMMVQNLTIVIKEITLSHLP